MGFTHTTRTHVGFHTLNVLKHFYSRTHPLLHTHSPTLSSIRQSHGPKYTFRGAISWDAPLEKPAFWYFFG